MDLSKAFDKMNHYALFLKLLKRKLPIQIIDIFVHWFQASLTCVRWGSSLLHFVKLVSGVRRGGVLSPQFFALFINDVIEELIKLNIGCRMSAVFVPIFVYADDIVLLAPSVGSLQTLLALLETLLENLDMRINATTSALYSLWTKSGRELRCCFDQAKQKYFSFI